MVTDPFDFDLLQAATGGIGALELQARLAQSSRPQALSLLSDGRGLNRRLQGCMCCTAASFLSLGVAFDSQSKKFGPPSATGRPFSFLGGDDVSLVDPLKDLGLTPGHPAAVIDTRAGNWLLRSSRHAVVRLMLVSR